MPASSAPVTVTLNPAIDETLFLETFTPGTVNRANRHHRQAGGKGVNVSAMLGGFGIRSVATGFLGRENPDHFEQLFARHGIHDDFIHIDGETRSGIKIVASSPRETTDINFPGAAPDADDLAALRETLADLAKPGRWFVLAGSLPAGLGPDDFTGLLEILKSAGALIAIDTNGTALKRAIECGVDLIKPNQHELGDILGRDLADRPAQIDAALEIQRECVPHVILSLGADGALFASHQGILHASPPPVRVVSTVGAGDSMLAGYLAGLITGKSPEQRARLASVFSWCALENVARTPPTPELAADRCNLIQISAPEV